MDQTESRAKMTDGKEVFECSALIEIVDGKAKVVLFSNLGRAIGEVIPLDTKNAKIRIEAVNIGGTQLANGHSII